MGERKSELDALGVTTVAVAAHADYQAQHLMDSGIPFELLLDPAHSLRAALGIDSQFSRWRLLHPRGALDYARAFRQTRNFDPIWSEATQRPAIVLLDRSLDPVWSYVGRRIGDYPTTTEVMGALDEALDGPAAQ